MVKKITLMLLALCAAAQISAVDKDDSYKYKDLVAGLAFGTVHGFINRHLIDNTPLTGDAALLNLFVIGLTYVVSNTYRNNYLAAYGRTDSTGLNIGHGLAQGLMEGSSYNHSTGAIVPVITPNLTLLGAAFGLLHDFFNK